MESDTITVELAEGDYELYCPVDGHKDQGMEGELVVEAVSRATVRDRQARSARALAKDGGLGPVLREPGDGGLVAPDHEVEVEPCG